MADSITVDTALARYYADHALPPDGGEQSRWFRVRLGPVTLPVPNPPARRRAVFLHDVHHLLTEYDTVFSRGELEIAGFEVGAGCGRVWIAWGINLVMMTLGVVLRPGLVLRAFARGRRSGSIYRSRHPRELLRRMTVARLAAELGIAPRVLRPTIGDRGRFAAWAGLGALISIAAAAIPIGIAWGLVKLVAPLVR